MATSTNVVLTDFGLRIYTTDANLDFEEAKTSTDMKEVEDVIGAENLGWTRESQDYHILAGKDSGWAKKAMLNFTTDDINLTLVRTDEGAYNKDSTYSFFYDKLKQYKVNKSFFGIVIARPVAGENAYEATYWNIFCSGIEDNATNDSGREYTVNLARSGAPVELDVTYTETTDTFSFTKKKAA